MTAMAKKSQIEKFREAARQAEADESEERFDETLKNLAKGHKNLPSSTDEVETGASPRQKPKSS
jgi:hypothetical protein